MTARLLLSFILLITSAIPSFAEKIGTIEEAIQAAKDNKEPAYIKTLMVTMSVKLTKFASTNVKSPKERLAWLLIMQGVLDVAQNSITQHASYAAWAHYVGNTGLSLANGAAWGALQSPFTYDPWDPARAAAWKAVREAAGKDIDKFARDANHDAAFANRYVAEFNQITQRAVEWAVLNCLLERIQPITTKALLAVLQALGDDPAENPFADTNDRDEDYLDQYYEQHFGQLNDNAMVFLTPWLIHSFWL